MPRFNNEGFHNEESTKGQKRELDAAADHYAKEERDTLREKLDVMDAAKESKDGGDGTA